MSLTFAAEPRANGISEIYFFGDERPTQIHRALTVGVVTTTRTNTGLRIIPVKEIGLEVVRKNGESIEMRIPVVMARGLAERIVEMCNAIDSGVVKDAVSCEGVDG